MSGWTNTNYYYLAGTITATITLDASNAKSGTNDLAWTTYNDGTYNDYNYTPTAYFYGEYISENSGNKITLGYTGVLQCSYSYSVNGNDYTPFTAWQSAPAYFNVEHKYFKLKLISYSSLWGSGDYIAATVTNCFIKFAKGETIYANQMNSNFQYLFSGDLIPVGGSSLTATNAIYDLGSSAKRYNNLYCNAISATTLTFPDPIFQKIVDLTLSATTGYFIVTGLNGDNDGIYYYILQGTGNSLASLSHAFAPATPDYSPHYHIYTNQDGYAVNFGSNITHTMAMISSHTQTNTSFLMESYLLAKTGNPKIIYSKSSDISGSGAQNAGQAKSMAFSLDITLTTTSIEFVLSTLNELGTGMKFNPGTRFQLFRTGII